MKKILFSIFSLIYLTINSKKILEIPFKTYYPLLEKNISNYMNVMYNSTIGTEIEIGTPSNKFIAMFSLNSYYTFILSNESKSKISPLFYHKLSSTYKLIESIRFFLLEYFNSGEFAEDKIKIGNKNFDKLNFALVTELNDNYADQILSTVIIGLKPNKVYSKQEFPKYTFLNQLKEKKYIDNYIFRFEFNSKNDNGKLIIGENPYEEDNDNFLRIRIGNFEEVEIQQTWGILFDNIHYGNYTFNRSTGVMIELNHEFIIAPINFLNSIKQDFFDKNKEKCNQKSLSYGKSIYYECEKDIDLSLMKNLCFELKSIEYSFVFEPKDLFVEFENKKFFIVIFFYDNINKWSFGKYFLKKYSIYFDKDKKIIGFYKYKKHNNSILIIIITFLLIIIIVGLIFIIFKILNKQRRKRVNELDDDFDYTTTEFLNK